MFDCLNKNEDLVKKFDLKIKSFDKIKSNLKSSEMNLENLQNENIKLKKLISEKNENNELFSNLSSANKDIKSLNPDLYILRCEHEEILNLKILEIKKENFKKLSEINHSSKQQQEKINKDLNDIKSKKEFLESELKSLKEVSY